MSSGDRRVTRYVGQDQGLRELLPEPSPQVTVSQGQMPAAMVLMQQQEQEHVGRRLREMRDRELEDRKRRRMAYMCSLAGLPGAAFM